MSEIDEAIAIVKFGQPLCCSERDAVIEVLERLQAENDRLRKKLKAETCKYNPGCLLYTTLGKELDEYDTEM